MSQEKIDSNLERALDEFAQYLSDLVPPLVVSDSIEYLLKYPPDLTAAAIHSWVTSQHRAVRSIPLSDYFFHALKKIHLMGEYNLVETSGLQVFLNRLKSEVLSYCPPEERESLKKSLERMEDGRVAFTAPVEVVYRQSSTTSQAHETRPEVNGSANATDVRGLALLLQRIEKQLASLPLPDGQADETERRQEVLTEVLAQAARSAKITVELEQALQELKRIGLDAGTEDVFRALGRSLPEWSLSFKPVAPLPEDGNLKAMHRIVVQSPDPREASNRFHQMINTAIERFNAGHLAQAASMIELADKIIASREVEEGVAKNLRIRGAEKLEIDRLRKYGESAELHPLLRTILNFFESLTPHGLLESLRRETKRDRRRLLLSLLEAHGEPAAAAALEHLRLPLHPHAGADETYFRRNLLYLLRRIPLGSDFNLAEIIDIAARHAELHFPPLLLKEAVACLAQFKAAKAEEYLISLFIEVESSIVSAEKPSPEIEERQVLLDRLAAALARTGTTRAHKVLLDHAFSKNTKLGNCLFRLGELSNHDLSTDPPTVERLLAALKANMPKKFLGMFLSQKDADLKTIVESLSSTSHPEVRQMIEEIAQRFSELAAGQSAIRILGNQSSAQKKNAETSVTSLTGDLDLFGLPGIFQSLSDHRLTGTLKIKTREGDLHAAVELQSGKFRSAEAQSLSGEAAFFQLLERPIPGTFEFVRTEATLDSGSKELLPLVLEGIRRFDELRHAEAILPDDQRLIAKSDRPIPFPEEKDGLLFRDLWNRVRNGATPRECESVAAVDPYRIRKLLAHWFEAGSIKAEVGK